MNRHESAGVANGAILLAILILGVAGFVAFSWRCPCERTPGGWLFGEVVAEPVEDWSFANDVPLCQLQVYRWGFWPHSINLNCMATDSRLYLSCARCDGKVWSSTAVDHPRARLRVGENVHPVNLERVPDPAELDEAWNARARKTGRGEGEPREDSWWSFRVRSR